MKVKITAWKYIQDDRDHTIEIETNLKTQEEFERAMIPADSSGKYVYELYRGGKFVMSFKSNKIF